MGIQPFIYHYLTDPDAWFLLASDHDMNYFDRINPRFKNTDDFDTEMRSSRSGAETPRGSVIGGEFTALLVPNVVIP